MVDARWLQLKEVLVAEGWVWRDNRLVSPHETMSFTTSDSQPDQALFRDAMTEAGAVDQHALHEDLVSLVAALDAILAN